MTTGTEVMYIKNSGRVLELARESYFKENNSYREPILSNVPKSMRVFRKMSFSRPVELDSRESAQHDSGIPPSV